jgi:sucrose-6-phosphate hydrolase SacC (GH32 family)
MTLTLRRYLLLLAVYTLLSAIAAAQQAHEKFPDELVKFAPMQAAPVFAGAEGKWDALIRERGWIIKEGDLWRLWYTGYAEPKKGPYKLGYATSSDGLNWRRHADNPIYGDHWVEDMMIVQDGGKYWMFAEGLDDEAHLLVSDDGLKWQRLGPLDVRMKNGQPIAKGPYGTPTAWREDGVWYLFYERGDKGVWLATSRDMKVWTNLQDEPVLRPGPGEYDRDMIALNQIIKQRGRYYAYYHGSATTGPNARLWSRAVATSTDLIHWDKYPGNPLQPVAQNKSSGILVHDGAKYRLYTMHPRVHVHAAAP